MRKLTFGMNMSLDGYTAAPGDDLGWSVPSDELFQWWSYREGGPGRGLDARTLREGVGGRGVGGAGAGGGDGLPWAVRQPAAGPASGADFLPPPLAGHAEGGVL